MGGPENRGAAHGPRRGGPECAQAHAALETSRPRRARPADRLRRAQPDPPQGPGALAVWAGCGVRGGGGRVQAYHSKSLQACGDALEAARLSPRLGVADRPTQWDLPGILGEPGTHNPGLGMTYRMKAHPWPTPRARSSTDARCDPG